MSADVVNSDSPPSTHHAMDNCLAIVATIASVVALSPESITQVASTHYLPHGFCYLWNPQLLMLHLISDAVIWLSYLVISVTLAYIVYHNRREVSFKGIFLAFGAFIIACGFTHFMDVVVLWVPLYWLAGDIKLLTAIASVATAIGLVILVPRFGELLERAKRAEFNARRFLAAAHSTLDAFYLCESVRDEAGQIIDFRFSFANTYGASLVSSTPEELVGKLMCVELPVNLTEGFFDKYKQVC